MDASSFESDKYHWHANLRYFAITCVKYGASPPQERGGLQNQINKISEIRDFWNRCMGARNFCRKILIRWDIASYRMARKIGNKNQIRKVCFLWIQIGVLMLDILFFLSWQEIGVSERSCERVERTNYVRAPFFFVNKEINTNER